MSDNRTMPQWGFKLSSMTDHEFAQFIRQHDLTYKQMLIGNVYSNKSGDSFAVVIFDNAAMTRAIWIKEGLQEFKFRKKEKQSTIQKHIEAFDLLLFGVSKNQVADRFETSSRSQRGRGSRSRGSGDHC